MYVTFFRLACVPPSACSGFAFGTRRAPCNPSRFLPARDGSRCSYSSMFFSTDLRLTAHALPDSLNPSNALERIMRITHTSLHPKRLAASGTLKMSFRASIGFLRLVNEWNFTVPAAPSRLPSAPSHWPATPTAERGWDRPTNEQGEQARVDPLPSCCRGDELPASARLRLQPPPLDQAERAREERGDAAETGRVDLRHGAGESCETKTDGGVRDHRGVY
jgi:hypothetical protein